MIKIAVSYFLSALSFSRMKWDQLRKYSGCLLPTGNIPLADYARMVTGEQGSKTVESEILTKGTSDKIFGEQYFLCKYGHNSV